MARTEGRSMQHGRPYHVVARCCQLRTREGCRRRDRESERPAVPLKPVKAGGGKGPWFKSGVIEVVRAGDWETW
jgi:hypothetical protein